jgi:asparagine synthase (glutamine-hydrolysing)
MPGIAGIISQRAAEECRSLVRYMVSSMKHEPFYESSTYSVPEMQVYAGWVAHEKSFSSGQPFVNEAGDVILLFSGECFADPEECTLLRQKGHELGHAAGSWLVHLYEEKGSRFFEKLNGSFSGLVIDKRKNRAFLFNDRYGVDRIYWHETTDALFFASEAKALLRILPNLRDFDPEGVAQFLAFRCTLGSRTLFRGISILPGGSLWSFEVGNCRKERYFSPQVWEAQSPLSGEAFELDFQDKFKRVLRRYFESECRIGVSLTAGLDSRMIMAFLPETQPKPICYTFAGPKQDTLDARLARQVASVCGLNHEILRLGSDFFANFTAHLEQTVYVTDGCLGALGAHEIYLNRQARQLSAVRLTGVFGGELLRGVSMFKSLAISPRLVNPGLRRPLISQISQSIRDGEHPVTFTVFREIPQRRFATPAASRSQLIFRTPYLDNDIVALAYRMPRSWRGSPLRAWSFIESNNPLLSRIPTDMGAVSSANQLIAVPRRMLSKAVCKLDYLYAEGLPHRLWFVDRIADSGVGPFGLHKFLHYRRWFKRELADCVADALREVQSRNCGIWNSDFLEIILREHEVDAVLTLDAVERVLLRDLPRGETAKDEGLANWTCTEGVSRNKIKAGAKKCL